MMDNKVIVDLEEVETKLKKQLSYSDWLKVYEFLTECEDYEQ